MPDFEERSGEALRRQSDLMRGYEGMMLLGMTPARRTDGTMQHWEVRPGESGYCQIDGSSALTFPLVEFAANRDTIIIRFTVLAAQFRAPIGTVLRLQEGDIFGDILEWRYHRDNGDLALNVTLRLHPASFQTSAQRGEAVRYACVVPISRYRRNMTREELLLDEQALSTPRYNQEAQLSEDDPYYQRLERAGLLPDRLEALRELMQESPSRSLSISQPLVNQPTTCRGCRHLHGQYHGGTLLVCAMHPYGNGEDCSDFEAK